MSLPPPPTSPPIATTPPCTRTYVRVPLAFCIYTRRGKPCLTLAPRGSFSAGLRCHYLSEPGGAAVAAAAGRRRRGGGGEKTCRRLILRAMGRMREWGVGQGKWKGKGGLLLFLSARLHPTSNVVTQVNYEYVSNYITSITRTEKNIPGTSYKHTSVCIYLFFHRQVAS